MSSPAGGDDPYVYAGTSVLRNKLDLRRAEDLAAFETEAVRRRTHELFANPARGNFDLQHLKEIHRRLFQDVYEWAGQLRTGSISKGNTVFAPVRTPVHSLESWGGIVFANLAREQYLRNVEPARFPDRLAHHFNEINYLHPFREGNGRSTRIFLNQLVEHAGYTIDLEHIGRKEWIAASIAAGDDDVGPLISVFTRMLKSKSPTSPSSATPSSRPPATR